MKTIWFASKNSGKIDELKYLMPDFQIKSILDLSESIEIEESGNSFAENALIKAKQLCKILKNQIVIADDTGLCIRELDDFPGIYSARWALPLTDWKAIVEALLLKMQNKGLKKTEQRGAYFQTALVVIIPWKNVIKTFEGITDGEIAFSQKGVNGFAYDMIFIPKNSNKTYAEMDFVEKQANSHRSIAISQLNNYLKSVL